MEHVRIEPLGMHTDLIDTTVGWHIEEFDPGGDVAAWTRTRKAEAQLAGIPCAWIAFVKNAPVGTVSLAEHNMDTRLDLRPWLAALFVLPAHRRRGIGSRLVTHCEEQAKSLGEPFLYLWTRTAEAFYERLRWDVISREDYEGELVAVMSRQL